MIVELAGIALVLAAGAGAGIGYAVGLVRMARQRAALTDAAAAACARAYDDGRTDQRTYEELLDLERSPGLAPFDQEAPR